MGFLLIAIIWLIKEHHVFIFTTTFVLWKSRNDHIFQNCRASQSKAKLYLKELLSFSLRLIDKPFCGRPFQAFCIYLDINLILGY